MIWRQVGDALHSLLATPGRKRRQNSRPKKMSDPKFIVFVCLFIYLREQFIFDKLKWSTKCVRATTI
jgi:hypothetical protein